MGQESMRKYRNKKVEFDGIKFDSMRERDYYLILRQMQKNGEISGLRYGINYELIPKNANFRSVVYKVDFTYFDKDGKEIFEDVKPKFNTVKAERKYKASGAYRVFKIKQKLMLHVHNILVLEV
jgi:hypothetical protein